METSRSGGGNLGTRRSDEEEIPDTFHTIATAKEVWDVLEKKYDTEEVRSKKYAVSLYLRYQMTNDKSVEAQSHEI
ncbi:putative serine/threonine-protein kinase MARK-A [Cucumis melo var. makuwa]|uniref:Serine/threonine-protein kinase MARK-A n=1 Tax=Cucumis melo var. makuwa TaxID=1194695 RepID=A0A5A7UC08_CUCMM|nr:putative serine/threonine-protein kinase MARK-A [Cucumis melo var. makuwa]